MAARKIAFDACGLPQLVVKVMRNEWEPLPTYYTAPFRRLVRLLLQPDPSQRPTCDQILGIRYVRECFEGILASMPPTAAAKLARQVFPESPYTAAPLEPARLHPEVSRMSKAPRRKKARGVPATGRPSATAERPKTSYLKPTGSSTAKAEEGVRKKETIMSKQRRELEKDVGAAARKKSSSAASGSAAESSRTTRRGTRRMGKSKSVATMSVKTAKRDWEARAALSDMREELAQRRWMAREMEAKRGRQLVRIRQMVSSPGC